jgi:hypothetical protein
VIVYEVNPEDADPSIDYFMPMVYLRTPVALRPGESYASASGITVRVLVALPGGFLIEVARPEPASCQTLRQRIAGLEEQLLEASPDEYRRVMAMIRNLRAQMAALGCSLT